MAPIAVGALLIGVVICALGLSGLAAPELFVRTLRIVQTPPLLLLAALVRVVFGVVLFRAARYSRVPVFLRVLGVAIVIGGLLTPFVGERMGHAILDWWSAHGPALIRGFSAFALALGAFIVWSLTPRRARTG